MLKSALFAGTFDPLTKGHVDIIRRAAPMFETLVIGVAENPEKTPFFSLDERLEQLISATKEWPHVKIAAYQGLTWQFAKQNKVSVLIRSLRPGEDHSHEFSLAAANKELGGLETLFLTASPDVSFISSSIVREILRAGGSAERYLA